MNEFSFTPYSFRRYLHKNFKHNKPRKISSLKTIWCMGLIMKICFTSTKLFRNYKWWVKATFTRRKKFHPIKKEQQNKECLNEFSFTPYSFRRYLHKNFKHNKPRKISSLKTIWCMGLIMKICFTSTKLFRNYKWWVKATFTRRKKFHPIIN